MPHDRPVQPVVLPLRITVLMLALLLASVVIYYAGMVLLVAFAGVLLAVMLRVPAMWLAKHTGMPVGLSLALVVLLLLGLVIAGVWAWGVTIAQQISQVQNEMMQSVAQIEEQIADYPWMMRLYERANNDALSYMDSQNLLTRAFNFASSAFGMVAFAVVALFVAFYLAAEPGLYRRGLIHLFPRDQRPEVRQLLDEMGRVLAWWLFGTLVMMLMVGGLFGIGLALLGVPSAIALGILAGVVEFVPYFGPIVAYIPAALISLPQGGDQLLWVTLLYIGIQVVESYILLPLIQRRAISVPPALLITMQVLLGMIAGFLGVLLAPPLTAVGMVAAKNLWVEDALGDNVQAQ
jgi:predicted PurR-regulated permease PerM